MLKSPEFEANHQEPVISGDMVKVFQIGEPPLEGKGLNVSITAILACQVSDSIDGEIAHACIEAARKEGVHYLALLNKQFVLDALREKAERIADHENA